MTANPDDTEPAVRIDRWLWAIRLYKTRSDASAACRGGHVSVGDRTVKPAHKVKIGDTVHARVGQRERIVVAQRLIDKRVGAAIAVDCYLDQSPPPPPKAAEPIFGVRDRGSGRPTKRERRQHEREFGRRR